MDVSFRDLFGTIALSSRLALPESLSSTPQTRLVGWLVGEVRCECMYVCMYVYMEEGWQPGEKKGREF